MAKKMFPDTTFLMVEAREEMRADLERVASQYSDVRCTIALLGPCNRPVETFYVNGSASSLHRENSDTPFTAIGMPMTTLDKITLASLRPPLFLKLDVQGCALDVLQGASTTLNKSEVVQLEVPLLPYNDGAPTAPEMIAFMAQGVFAIFDIASFIRPKDKHLVAVDIVFVRNDSKLRPTLFRFMAQPKL